MKNIKQYNDYILEKYSADWSRIGSTLYYFNIESNKYFVKFSDTYNLVYVSFGIVDENEKWSYKDLDKSNAFKTMSTVSEIVKDFISKNTDVKKIVFFGRYDKDNKPTEMPRWLGMILGSTNFTYILTEYLTVLLSRPSQWIKKPTQRTNMFSRWADREIKDLNWKVNRIGNEIQLVKVI